jgi:diazepam-binding inhibitor (GABA receptor modulating acyl-CoA-binding protein)
MNDEKNIAKIQGSEEMRSNLEKSFHDAAARIKTRATMPSNGDLLFLYGLYKQATTGDCNVAQPWAVQIESRVKWEAWNKNKGMERMNAMRQYVDKVEELMSGEAA